MGWTSLEEPYHISPQTLKSDVVNPPGSQNDATCGLTGWTTLASAARYLNILEVDVNRLKHHVDRSSGGKLAKEDCTGMFWHWLCARELSVAT